MRLHVHRSLGQPNAPFIVGDYDFIVISEGPYEGVAPSSIVTAASGTVVELKTTIAVPASDMKTLFSKAGKLAAGFTPAGVGPAANA